MFQDTFFKQLIQIPSRKWNIELQTGGIPGGPSSHLKKSWFQSHFQSYESYYIHKLFKRKNIISNHQIMVLNFTRYSNSLILMSNYIAEEQNLPANLQ